MQCSSTVWTFISLAPPPPFPRTHIRLLDWWYFGFNSFVIFGINKILGWAMYSWYRYCVSSFFFLFFFPSDSPVLFNPVCISQMGDLYYALIMVLFLGFPRYHWKKWVLVFSLDGIQLFSTIKLCFEWVNWSEFELYKDLGKLNVECRLVMAMAMVMVM